MGKMKSKSDGEDKTEEQEGDLGVEGERGGTQC